MGKNEWEIVLRFKTMYVKEIKAVLKCQRVALNQMIP